MMRRMTVSFECRTLIGASVEAVFDLSLDIDAHLGSMRDSDERAVAGVTSGQIDLGEQVTWKARHYVLPFTMTSEIVELERPVHFVDQQVRGPFHFFRHEHHFEPAGQGCVMIDRVRFQAPFGLIGRAVERLTLDRYVRGLIAKRNEFLRDALDPEPPDPAE